MVLTQQCFRENCPRRLTQVLIVHIGDAAQCAVSVLGKSHLDSLELGGHVRRGNKDAAALAGDGEAATSEEDGCAESCKQLAEGESLGATRMDRASLARGAASGGFLISCCARGCLEPLRVKDSKVQFSAAGQPAFAPLCDCLRRNFKVPSRIGWPAEPINHLCVWV